MGKTGLRTSWQGWPHGLLPAPLRRSFGALLLMAAGATGAGAADTPAMHTAPRAVQADPAVLALRALDECLHRLDPQLDVGYPRVAARCPELTPALVASPWAPWLPRDWDRPGNELSAAGLKELRTLLIRPTPVARTPAPRVTRVSAVLAGLAVTERPRGGWWTRLKQWLRELFTPQPRTDNGGWLRRLFGDTGLSQALLQIITWSALAITVALATAIVANELRVAGLLKRRRSQRQRAAGDEYPALPPSLREVDQAGPQQQPPLLLELIIARLRSQERLPPPRALTVQELERAVRLPCADDRERFAALVHVCERIRFAGHELPPAMVTAALARGRELLGSLEAG